MAFTWRMLVGEAEQLQCRVPSDSDAAVRVSQVLQLARLVQVSQDPVSFMLFQRCGMCCQQY